MPASKMSWLYIGISPICAIVSDVPAGISSLQARSAAILSDALRRLPHTPRIFNSSAMSSLAGKGAKSSLVPVAVVLVVHMRVLVRHRLVDVRVAMPLRDVQPDAERHQHCRGPEAVTRKF